MHLTHYTDPGPRTTDHLQCPHSSVVPLPNMSKQVADPEKHVAQSEHSVPDDTVVIDVSAELVTHDKTKLDISGEYLALHHAQYHDYTPKEESRVRWKIDLRLVPMMFVTQTLLAVDVRCPRFGSVFSERSALTSLQKVAVSNAALYGMVTDTHLVGQQYSWGEYSVSRAFGACGAGRMVQCLAKQEL